MNRILIDGIENKKVDKINKTITVMINKSGNYFIDDNTYKYIFNIENCNINIFFNIKNSNTLDLKYNICKANVSCNIISFSGVNQNIEAEIKGDNASIDIYNSQITYDEVNINTYVNHLSSNTKSNIYNCVATKEKASCNIKVVSKLGKGNKNCIINQDSRIISLNNTNKNRIEPILLIDEYDVSASHSAFIGKFDEKDLFYLMSRGLTEKEANNVLLNAFLIGKLNITEEEKDNLKYSL